MRIARMPRYIRDGGLALRPLRVFDAPFLKAMLHDEEGANVGGPGMPPSVSSFSIWWSVGHIFPLAYCVEFERKRIGFIGIYDLKLGQSAKMSLAIVDSDFRQKGYGGRVFNLVAHNLRRHRFVQKVFVEVETANYLSLSFWQKLGFREDQRFQRKTVLSLSL